DTHRSGNDRQFPDFQRNKPADGLHLRRLGRQLHGKIRSWGRQLLPAGFVVWHAADHLPWHGNAVQPEDPRFPEPRRKFLPLAEYYAEGAKAPGHPMGDLQPAEPCAVWRLERRHLAAKRQLRQLEEPVELSAAHAGLDETLLVTPSWGGGKPPPPLSFFFRPKGGLTKWPWPGQKNLGNKKKG